MTLLLAAAAAAVTTILWYTSEKARQLSLGTLALLYWGASLMWLVDAIHAYLEQGAAYFTPAVAELCNDTFLGASVVLLGLVIWLVIVLVRDPLGTVRKLLRHEE